MANNTSRRGNGEPDYFEPGDSHRPKYSTADPRDDPPQASSPTRRNPSPSQDSKMTSPHGRADFDDVSPELIAAITERVKREVVEHLKQTATASTEDQTNSISNKPENLKWSASVEDAPESPPLHRVPEKKVDRLNQSNVVEDELEAPPLQRAPSNKSQSSSSSPPPTARGVYTPPSPTQATRPGYVVPPSFPPPPSEPIRSPPSSPLDKPSGVRFSDRPLPRPGGARTYSTLELSTIDQKWGRLFSNEGDPTERLGQFLRGLANHIIEEFPPKKSIVVTPPKMLAYYTSHAVDNEIHPLVSIFRAQANEQISQLYQDLGCQHHMIQDHESNAPTIPALTPTGFAHWMTIQILAYPEEEAKRLETVVLAMPIDADGVILDGKPERLPKQISRHLLPEKEDRKSRKLIEKAISNFFDNLGTSSRRKASTMCPSSRLPSTTQSRSHPVEIHQTRTSPTTSKAQPIERDRNPYTATPILEPLNNEETVKIERERQPYSAQPGSGRVYSEGISLSGPPMLARANSASRTRDHAEAKESRHHRTQSAASQNYMPPPRAAVRRPNSPPPKSFSNSTPDDLGGYQYVPPSMPTSSSFPNQSQPFGPSSYGSTGSIPPPPPHFDRDRRVRDDRQHRRSADEETTRLTGEFNSPRDAERWDRIQDSRSGESDRKDKPYESRPPVAMDPRGVAYEDYYREGKGKGVGHDGYSRH